MSAAVLLAGAAAAAGAALLTTWAPDRGVGRAPDDRRRPDRAGLGDVVRPPAEVRPDGGPEPPAWTWPASVVAGAGVWFLLGGVAGLVLGLLTVSVLPILIARLEPAAARRRRLLLVRSGPLVADLLAASLSAGIPLEAAVPQVAGAIGGPAGQLLDSVHRRWLLGEATERTWAAVVAEPGVGGVARAVVRSSRTGAPLADLLSQTAADLRDEASAAALTQVRAASVKAVLPLGLCLLPAFVLLGIVPVIGGLIPQL